MPASFANTSTSFRIIVDFTTALGICTGGLLRWLQPMPASFANTSTSSMSLSHQEGPRLARIGAVVREGLGGVGVVRAGTGPG